MSGTSVDGVDGVLSYFSESGRPQILSKASEQIPVSLRQELLALNTPGDNELHRSALAANAISDLYARVVFNLLEQAGLKPVDIAAIGAHGQTVRHRPELGYTSQLLAPARLAELSGIAVIADFRSRDVAAGGQGAPLVPAFHRAVFGTDTPLVILNLGGIANVTLLRPDRPVIGFDTGPANMLLDLWCQRHTGKLYDADGKWAASAPSHPKLLKHLIESEPWFALPPPKSTGRDLFNPQWLDSRLSGFESVEPAHTQATLLALTVQSIVAALGQQDLVDVPIYACGGGARNLELMQRLAQAWEGPVSTTDTLGIGTQDMEALAFAWLAWAHLNKNAGNLPEVTGANGFRILGACWPA
ncbi:anhydro-N-acetylmuramic acid kinase [Orrella daihaiensis]|uniref:Anhydro-N-acetylmuramic acid kinase n=2 Tax=Orrella daihaiensis TaxID=2782176 RepID=A0ABY4AUH0_9BURK|nr:anhydro-N-acetylmuramic acid kinase [Orrella daihaiensis]